MTITLVFAVVTSTTLSLVTTAVLRWLAKKYGWAAGPRSERHIHRRPIPRFGGVGIFVSSLFVIVGVTLLAPGFIPRFVLAMFIPASAMFAVGLWDDIRPLSAKLKLLVQIGCGAALFEVVRGTPLGQSFGGHSPIVLLVVAIIWTVIVSNSINLIDGIDGLAGGTAALSLAAVAIVAVRSGQWGVVLVSAVLVGSILGFLRFNVNPASVFLGDGGSLFLGFMISALGLSWSGSHAATATVVVAVAILALPLAETGVSVTRRFLSGRRIFEPDREHIHHKLLDKGFSQRQTAFVLHTVSLVCGLAGIGIATGHIIVKVVCCIVLIAVLVIGVVSLGYMEFRELGRLFCRLLEQRKVLANDVALRHLAQRIEKSRCLAVIGDELTSSLKSMDFDGFQLIFNSAVVEGIPVCKARSQFMKWGYTQETRAFDPACFRVGFDLTSEMHGKLGWVILSRRLDRENVLFDSNVLLAELVPAIVAGLERCMESSCTENAASKVISPDFMTPLSPQPVGLSSTAVASSLLSVDMHCNGDQPSESSFRLGSLPRQSLTS